MPALPHTLLCGLVSLLCFLFPAQGKETPKMLIAGCGLDQIALIDKDGKILWSIPYADEASDAVLLPNGNILHSAKQSGIREIKPDYASGKDAEVVWKWEPPLLDGKKGEVHSCQPLPGGKILVGESHDNISFIKEIDRKTGKTLKTVELRDLGGSHSTFRQIRKTPDGTYLVTQQKDGGKALEFNSSGKLLRTFPAGRFTAVRLPGGNTLIACGDDHKLIEVDRENKIVWEVNQKDIPGSSLGFVAGVQRLPNGNTVICNWGGHGGSSGPAIIEITKDKKVVWSSPPEIKNRVSSVQVTEPAILSKTQLR